MTTYKNEGARLLDKRLMAEKVSRSAAARKLQTSKSHMTKILTSVRIPGRTLSLRIQLIFDVPADTWDLPPKQPKDDGGESALPKAANG